MAEDFRGFPQPLQANTEKIPGLRHDCFILYPFQFIMHLSESDLTLYSLVSDCVLKTCHKENKKWERNGNCFSSMWSGGVLSRFATIFSG
jgi:hypothetical protein